jgi:signal peptidase I
MYPTIRSLFLFLLVGMTAVIAAAIGTGRVAYEVTEGTSMEPTYHSGDLVVTARTDSYRIGDIVAYRNNNEEHVILHRITGGDAAGFVLKGDNNQSSDSTKPAADEVIGRAVLHIPNVGAVLRPPISHGLLGGLVLILVGGLFVSPYPRSAVGPGFVDVGRRVGKVCRALVVVDVFVLVGVALTFASPRPAASATAVRSSQTGVLAYHADVPVSDTYPTGAVVTGDPVFTNLLDSVAVSFHYTTDAAPASVHGTVGLELDVSAPSGWHTSLPLVPATELAAGSVDVTGTVDLRRIIALADRVAEATGVGVGATLDVTVIATASVSLDEADPVAFGLQLPFKLTPLTLALSGVKPSASPLGPVVSSTTALDAPAPARRSGPTPNRVRLVLLAVLLVCATATLMLWPRRADASPAPGEAG